MHPSSNNNGCKPPKTSFFGNYYNDTNYSRALQEYYYPPSFLLPSPNYIPLEDEAVFCESFQQQQYFSNDHHNHLAHEMTTNVESIMGECGSNNGQVARNDGDDEPYDFSTHAEPESSSPRKRHSKGDRHSKIDTARGPRDRRMRLSLDVAKKLFGLQDLLGFDKASKTVDWLLTKSRTAILELLPDRSCSFMGVSNYSASSTSECEVLSGTAADQSMLKTGDDQAPTTNNNNKEKSTSGCSIKKHKEKIARGVLRRSAGLHHPIAKATRERARVRARERTIEKRSINNKIGVAQDSKCRPCLDQVLMNQHESQLGSWSIFEENQCQTTGQPDQMSSHFQFKQGFVGHNSSPMMTGNWSPSYMLNYQHNIAGLAHEHHSNDFQAIGKSWEGN
ncbi:transcription factor TCP18 [Lactuca sativa]|uniref:TCP domain-containing protein n=1 Tax=Lactuca sativa TaxID=4236 RepID=A0A9R1WH91_LACSA|nr:transcription factor TCP18 [Lactuca sativa]XP_042755280.1 transcription factor TCP18 [Lactuca sativa]KAJ0225170.1 hypothetical protein LSAT_V11C100007030 [Lactuca sativa]